MVLSIIALNANVTINSTSYQEEVTTSETGEKVKSWVKTHKVVPGSVVRYVNTLENSGTQPATSLVVNNPIPEHMEYVAGTASCQSGCLITYSVDGGQTFKQASELFIEGEERHLAKASEYTDIRWVVEKLPSMAQSNVEYQARLK